MAKRKNEILKVNCVYKDDGKSPQNVVTEAFSIFIKEELARKSA